jgi:hypothetical protein
VGTIISLYGRERVGVSFPYIDSHDRLLRHYLFSLRSMRRLEGMRIKRDEGWTEYFVLFPARYFHVVLDIDRGEHNCAYNKLRVWGDGEVLTEPWDGGYPEWCEILCEKCFRRRAEPRARREEPEGCEEELMQADRMLWET